MKKIIITLLLLLLVTLLSFFVFHSGQKHEKQKENYQNIPVFQLPDIHGNIIDNSMLQSDVSTLFVFFDPGCNPCREEMTQINAMRNNFSSSQLVFFSMLPAEDIKTFFVEIDFTLLSNMYFLIDRNGELIDKMDIKSSPASYIYNEKGELTKQFDGPVKAETLIKYLSE